MFESEIRCVFNNQALLPRGNDIIFQDRPRHEDGLVVGIREVVPHHVNDIVHSVLPNQEGRSVGNQNSLTLLGLPNEASTSPVKSRPFRCTAWRAA